MPQVRIGVNNVARNVTQMRVGVNGVARNVTAAYIGVDGVARRIWPLDFTGDGRFLAVAGAGYPYLLIYERAGESFTKLRTRRRFRPAFAAPCLLRRTAFILPPSTTRRPI